MKKNLIAVAVAAAMAAPLAAQADVKVSGQLQQELVSWAGDAAADGFVLDEGGEYASTGAGNASMVGVTASQDLDGGMKALAKANFNLSVDENAGLTGRDAYVGLTGGFGTFLAGKMNTPYKSSTVSWDPFLATFMQARGSFGMSGLGHNGYADNALAYANTFGNVKLVAAIVVDEAVDTTSADGDLRNEHGMSISVNMPVGPVELAVAHINAAGDPDDDDTANKIGVQYAAGDLTVSGQIEMIGDALAYSELETGYDAIMGAGSFAALGVTPDDVGSSTVMYVNATFNMGNGNTLAAAFGNTAYDEADDTDATYMAIGLKHAFSKAVTGHVGYRSSDTDLDNSDATAFGAGLRVKF